jgi:biotin carboxyl carrier protein
MKRHPLLSEIEAVVNMYMVEEGASVSQGEHVVMLECMKMQFYVDAPCDGVVHFKAKLGETISVGTLLAEVEET